MVDAGCPAVGSLLAGKYRVERLLGAGGMGVVVAATHVMLQELYAVKLMRPRTVANPQAVERFVREARAVVRLRSEHAVRVHDIGRLDDGAPYLVMEYLEGESLSAQLRRAGPMPLAVAADYLLQALVAIAEAHGVGIIHRDLKPANLFVTQTVEARPCLKVLDFGVSKLAPASQGQKNESITATGQLLGSPAYMAPEQLRGQRDIDGRADLWSIGAILFELLTATRPFDGRTLADLARNIVVTETPSVCAHRPDIPDQVEAVIASCLSKERTGRPASAAELARLLAPFGTRASAALPGRAEVIALEAKRALQRRSRPDDTSALASSSWPPPPPEEDDDVQTLPLDERQPRRESATLVKRRTRARCKAVQLDVDTTLGAVLAGQGRLPEE